MGSGTDSHSPPLAIAVPELVSLVEESPLALSCPSVMVNWAVGCVAAVEGMVGVVVVVVSICTVPCWGCCK